MPHYVVTVGEAPRQDDVYLCSYREKPYKIFIGIAAFVVTSDVGYNQTDRTDINAELLLQCQRFGSTK